MQKDSEKSAKKKSRTKKSSYSFGSRTFLWRGRVNFGPEGKLQIFSFVGLFIPGCLFLMHEAQFTHGIEEELGRTVWLVTCYTVSVSFLVLFIICSVSDPGYLTTPLSRNKRRQMPSVQIKGDQEFCLHYCTSCCIFRPLRTHHCKICDLCVKERDHHCPFLNNCVGLSNRRVYVYFLILSVLQETIILAETLCQIIKPFAKEGVTFVAGIQRLSVIFAAIQCLYAIILGTNLTSLLVFQMKLVFQNSTTDQLRRLLANPNNNPHSDDLELSRLFNEGCLKNVRSILCCSSPAETIYQNFEPLNVAYLAKRCNFFRKKKYLSKNGRDNPEQEHNNNNNNSHNLQHPSQFVGKATGGISQKMIFGNTEHQQQQQHLAGDSLSHKSSRLHSEKYPQDVQEDTFHIAKSDHNHMKVPHIALRDIELKEMYNHHVYLNTHFHFQPNLQSGQISPHHNHNDEGWNGENLFGPAIKEHIRPIHSSAASSSPSPHNQSISADVERLQNLPHIDMNPFDSISLNQDDFQEVESHPMASEQSPAIRIITQTEHDQSDTDQGLTEQEDFDRNPAARKINGHSFKDSPFQNKKNQLNKQSQFKSKEIDIGPAPRLKPITFSSVRSKDKNTIKYPTSNFYSENKEESTALNQRQTQIKPQGVQTRSKAKRTLTNFEAFNTYSSMLQSTNINSNNTTNKNTNENSITKYSKRDNHTDHMGLTQINAIDLKDFDISPVDHQTTITDDFNYPSAIQAVTVKNNYNSKRIKKGFHPPIIKQQQNDLMQQNHNLQELEHKGTSSEFDTNGSSNYQANLQAQLVVAAMSP